MREGSERSACLTASFLSYSLVFQAMSPRTHRNAGSEKSLPDPPSAFTDSTSDGAQSFILFGRAMAQKAQSASELDSLKYIVDRAHVYVLENRKKLYDDLWQDIMFVQTGEPPSPSSLRAAIIYTQALIVPLDLLIRELRARVQEVPEKFAAIDNEELFEQRAQPLGDHHWKDEKQMHVLFEMSDRQDLIQPLIDKIAERHAKQDEVMVLQKELMDRLQTGIGHRWPIVGLSC